MRYETYDSVAGWHAVPRAAVLEREPRVEPRPPASPRAFDAQARALGFDVFDRMLLNSDGTVTTLLESCVGEPVATKTTLQAGPAVFPELVANTGLGRIQTLPGCTLRQTRSSSRGARLCTENHTGAALVLAESLLVPDRLPRQIATAWRRNGSSIGRLLNSTLTETRRELLEIGRMRAGESSEHLGAESSTSLAWRTYQIFVATQPAVLISEMIVPGRLSSLALRSSPPGP